MDPSLYLDRDTWVHRLDPRTKIFLLLGMFALPFVFLNPLYVLAVLVLVLFFGYLAQCLANLRRIWFILFMIIVVTPILWSIVGSGRTPLFLFVEREALLYGLSATQRIVITVIAGMIFLSTTRNEEVALGLVPTIVATGLTIGQAQRSRGLDLESGNIFERIRKHLPLLVPVFVTTVRSTNVFSMALESKGFGARPGRTFFLHTAMGGRDALIMVAFVVILAGCIALRVAGYGGLEGFSR